jgi:hypothetical protein
MMKINFLNVFRGIRDSSQIVSERVIDEKYRGSQIW